MILWDIDEELETIEAKFGVPGTIIQRVLVDPNFMKAYGLTPTPEQLKRFSGVVWCIGIGQMQAPKKFYYGHTLREAVTNAAEKELDDRDETHTSSE